jgi:Asp-tRNA(Asn)/Glu-tRNA(Gln) amidotransferase A subunit family amidase
MLADLASDAIVDPSAAVEVSLERIGRWDSAIRAFASVDTAGARRRALRLASRGSTGAKATLFGWTLGVKDVIDTRGVLTAYGSRLFESHVPARDASVITRLRHAGAILVGKTITTEFATFELPPTVNPWDPNCTPGGSSSGSAAAVASGMVRFAIGTQTAGSVIRPASYCGVVGYVPSPGWVSRRGVFPFSWSLDRVGFFARSVGDVAHAFRASTGFDQADPDSIRVSSNGASTQKHLKNHRIAIVAPLLDLAETSMRDAVASVATILTDAGCEVMILQSIDWFEEGFAAHLTIMRAELAAVHEELYSRNGQRYGPRISAFIESGIRITATEYLHALRIRRLYRCAMAELFSDTDLILAPSATGPAPPRSHATTGDPTMNIPAMLAGLPAISVPVRITDEGLPLGVQLVARTDRDFELIGVARHLERRLAFASTPAVEVLFGAPAD